MIFIYLISLLLISREYHLPSNLNQNYESLKIEVFRVKVDREFASCFARLGPPDTILPPDIYPNNII